MIVIVVGGGEDRPRVRFPGHARAPLWLPSEGYIITLQFACQPFVNAAAAALTFAPMKALSLAGFLVISVIGAARADPPRVVASIVPVHAIVAAVMAGVAAPALVVKRGGSPHAYALRPSDARALAQANLVFWMGEGLETFLAKPLAALADTARVVTLTDAEGIRHLPVRAGGAWEQRAEDDAGGKP
ncbi:MAG: zinc ABC transporter substrate-binding protein, partial [Proteobacteria bacterium]|nr:zinc ABC transporter substrate-binding protein [Pseudomonadota bacterium]